MQLQLIFTSLLGFATAGSCFPSATYPAWHPPTRGESRSVCPALNAYANHGILPHNGRNITVEMLANAMDVAMNIPREFGAQWAELAMSLNPSPNPALKSIDLEHLNKHNALEHDGSLTRADYDMAGPDYWKFNQRAFNEVLGYWKGSSNIDIAAAAAARHGRIMTSKKTNPKFAYPMGAVHGSYIQTAIYYLTMIHPSTGLTNVDFVRVLFEQERLPYKEGWVRPKDTIATFSLTSTVMALALATPNETTLYTA